MRFALDCADERPEGTTPVREAPQSGRNEFLNLSSWSTMCISEARRQFQVHHVDTRNSSFVTAEPRQQFTHLADSSSRAPGFQHGWHSSHQSLDVREISAELIWLCFVVFLACSPSAPAIIKIRSRKIDSRNSRRK
jgi:hypothetical protein